MALTFHSVGEPVFEILKTWFADPELIRRIEFPTARWFDYVRHTPGVYAWLIFDENTPVAHVQFDIEDTNNASQLVL